MPGCDTVSDTCDISAGESSDSRARSPPLHAEGTELQEFGEISGIIAHEIAQPLTAILGDAEAALRALGDTSAVRDILKDIIASVQRASEIIKHARTMLQDGGLHCEPHSLNELVTTTLRVAHHELAERNVTLELQLEPNLECVRVDHVQIEQVILNLVVNACEAMEKTPSDQRRLHVATCQNRNEIELCIEDSGVGIAPEEREHIFQPFVTSKPSGLGLGLAICRFIVRAHGGELWAESAQRGALFRMTLPKTPPFAQVDWIANTPPAARE